MIIVGGLINCWLGVSATSRAKIDSETEVTGLVGGLMGELSRAYKMVKVSCFAPVGITPTFTFA